MQTRVLCFAAALCVGLGVGPFSGAVAQEGAPAGAPAQPPAGARTPPKPKNLQVLPENTDLRKVMHEYEAALGVECEFCHAAADPTTHRADRASDANPRKDVARYMIRMTDDLNGKYLAQLPKAPDVDADAKVTCGTCHRGHAKPEAFVPPPRQEGPRPGGAPPAGTPPPGI